MDPISIAGIVESSLSLGLQLGNAAKSIGDIAGKYKNAQLTLKSLAQNLELLQLTWTQIGQWFEACAEEGNFYDNNLIKRVTGFLETGTVVMDALEKDLLAYDIENINFAQRSKLIWNENTMQGHQVRIRDQTFSMSLFLQVVKLPTPKARAKLLRNSEDQFRKSDESAYSIDSFIPSHLSQSTSPRRSLAESSQESMEYRPLSFENKLFMSKVYMRNSKNMMIKKVFRMRTQPKGTVRGTTQSTPNWEAIRNELDADSLLPPSRELFVEDDKTIRPYDDHESRVHGRQQFDNSNTSAQRTTALLIEACEQGNNVLLKELLVGGVDVNAPFSGIMYSGYTAIHVAALYGHTDVLQTLLDHSANINEEDAKGKRQPLHFAAGSRQRSMVGFLIKRGAQVNAKDRNAVQPIHEATWSGSIDVLDLLIQAGAAVDCSDRLGYQPLHWTTFTPNQPDVIKYLLYKKADIDAKVSDGLRAVHLTCRTDPKNLGTLLTLGAKTDYDDGTDPALITAVNAQNKVAVEMLLKHGVDPDRRARDGSTALHTLARLRSKSPSESSNDKEICQLLLDYGANVNLKDGTEHHVLHCLASYKFTSMADFVAIEELAKLVLDRGAGLNTTTSQGYTPLYLAICCGDRLFSRLLIRSGSRLLVRTDVLLAEIAEMEINWQAPKSWYTVNVWRYSLGVEQQWGKLPYLAFKLSIDDDGFITQSAMEETFETMELLISGSHDSSSF